MTKERNQQTSLMVLLSLIKMQDLVPEATFKSAYIIV